MSVAKRDAQSTQDVADWAPGDGGYLDGLVQSGLMPSDSNDGRCSLNPAVLPKWLIDALGHRRVAPPEMTVESGKSVQVLRHDADAGDFNWLALLTEQPALHPDLGNGVDVRRVLEVIQELAERGVHVLYSVALFAEAEDRFTIDVWMLELPLETPPVLTAWATEQFARAGGARTPWLTDALHWEFDGSTAESRVSQ